MVGTVASLGLLTASAWSWWLAVPAVLVALAAGFLATWAALAEFAEWRANARAEAAAERAEQRERTQALHASQRHVLATVDARMAALQATVGDMNVELGQSQQQLSRLRGDNEALRIETADLRTENAELRLENTGLRDQVRDLTAARDTEQEDVADVFALPRRRASGNAGEWDVLDAPTVVDLDLQRLASPFVAEVQRRHAN